MGCSFTSLASWLKAITSTHKQRIFPLTKKKKFKEQLTERVITILPIINGLKHCFLPFSLCSSLISSRSSKDHQSFMTWCLWPSWWIPRYHMHQSCKNACQKINIWQDLVILYDKKSGIIELKKPSFPLAFLRNKKDKNCGPSDTALRWGHYLQKLLHFAYFFFCHFSRKECWEAFSFLSKLDLNRN